MCVSQLVTFSLHGTKLLFWISVVLRYILCNREKCHVLFRVSFLANVAKRMLHSLYHYWREFLSKWEEIVSNHFFSSKTLWFLFLFKVFWINFWTIYLITFYFFFRRQSDRVFFGFCLLFFRVMVKHNRFFELMTFCYIPAGCF